MSTSYPGMGPIFRDGGVAFRLWAPHADEVQLTGDFNQWGTTNMASEGNGHWYADVDGAKAGDKYRIKIRHGQDWLDRVDPRAPQVTNSVGDGVLYDHSAFDWQGDSYTLPGHNELVVYELHVGSFVNDGSGPADLWAVTERLDHFTQLGINCIELMPVMEFAGDYSWGYNPAHLFAIESAYGGPDALKTFVRECHKRGIGVLVDVVYNHFGPSDLATWQFDGWSENDKGGIYFYNDDRSATPWGDSRPDYGRPEVRDFLRDNALMFLREYRMDGLRYDMTPFVSSVAGGDMDLPDGWSLMQWINESIRNEMPGKILIAEDLHNNPSITDTGDNGAKFHAQWDARFVHPVRAAALADDGARSMAEVQGSLVHSFSDDSFTRVVYTESHDEVSNGRARVPQEVDGGDNTSWIAQKMSTSIASLVFTAAGIPMIFQGQEFLQGEYFQDSVPLDWSQNAEFRGIVRLYRDLIALRRNLEGHTRGLQGQHTQVLKMHDEANVIAYHRWADGGPDDSVVVVVNFSDQVLTDYRIGMPAAGTWTLRLNSDATSYSPDFSDSPAHDLEAAEGEFDGAVASASVAVGPYSTLIYSLAG